jgi:hypothetical protein
MLLFDLGSILGAHFFQRYFRSEGGREIRFSKEKKHNSRGAFAKINLPHHQTNGGHHRLTKTLMCGNFMTQKSRFASS